MAAALIAFWGQTATAIVCPTVKEALRQSSGRYNEGAPLIILGGEIENVVNLGVHKLRVKFDGREDIFLANLAVSRIPVRNVIRGDQDLEGKDLTFFQFDNCEEYRCVETKSHDLHFPTFRTKVGSVARPSDDDKAKPLSEPKAPYVLMFLTKYNSQFDQIVGNRSLVSYFKV